MLFLNFCPKEEKEVKRLLQKDGHFSELYVAANDGDLRKIRAMIKAGAELNRPETALKLTPLYGAVYAGHIQVIKELICAGADPNWKFAYKAVPPLFSGIATGQVEVVKALLDHGANIHARNLSDSALHAAVEQGHMQIAKLFIQRGLDVNIRNDNDETPLHIAVKTGNAQMVRFLLEEGADVSAKSTDAKDIQDDVKLGSNITPLFLAVYWRHLDITDILIKAGADVNARTSLNHSALHFAAREGPIEMVNILLKAGSDVNAVSDVLGYTPLLPAVVSGHLDIASTLIKAGANVNARTSQLYTPLHAAVNGGHYGIVKMLLKAGSDINAQMDDDVTPLRFAVQTNRYDIAELLLKCKAVVDLRESVQGTTPLFLAVQLKHEQLVKLFIENGADVNVENKFGLLPIHIAASAKSVEIVKLLLSNGSYYCIEAQSKSYSGTPLELARKAGSAPVVTMLTLIGKLFRGVMKNDLPKIEHSIQAGAIINARNVSGRTALHYAVESGNVKAVNMLLTNNADISYTSKKGNLPLHIAVGNENQEIIKILLTHAEKITSAKRNFAVNARTTESGNSALHVAAKQNNIDVVKILIANGAVYNVKNKSGKLPVQLTSNKEIETLLFSAEKLFEAVKNEGSLEEVKQILEDDNSTVNARDADGGGTLLYWSVAKGHADIVNVLLCNGADYRLVTKKGTTPLQIAASKGNVEIIKALVERAKMDNAEKVNNFIDAATASGTVALHVACNLEVVKCLMQAGATYNIRNGEGRTALELSRDEDIRKLLKTTHQMFEDVEKGASTVVNSWNNLKNDEFKAITSAKNEQGQTLLQVAHVKIAGKLRKKLKAANVL